MSRVGDQRKKSVNINITMDAWWSAKAMAESNGISFSAFIEQLILKEFEKYHLMFARHNTKSSQSIEQLIKEIESYMED